MPVLYRYDFSVVAAATIAQWYLDTSAMVAHALKVRMDAAGVARVGLTATL